MLEYLILILYFLISFGFDWKHTSNTNGVPNYIDKHLVDQWQTILRHEQYFQVSSRCVEMLSNAPFRVRYMTSIKGKQRNFATSVKLFSL